MTESDPSPHSSTAGLPENIEPTDTMPPAGSEELTEEAPFRSLRELVDRVSGREYWTPHDLPDAGLAEVMPFPFLALVGQQEMKIALLLALVNPALSGVLLVGPRGTGKTTAVRSLADLLPLTLRSLCYYGCMPEDVETGGIDAVCPDCARKYGQGEPLAAMDPVRLIELPINARLEDVVGGVDERAVVHERLRFRRGILAQADRNLLYIDEVNLLPHEVTDAILDAAAQGLYTVRRGPLAATYRARFVLIGSMNPEEGRLRPQIMDRFGLRVVVRGLQDPPERLEVYRRVRSYMTSPRQVSQVYGRALEAMRADVQEVRDRLPSVKIPEYVASAGLDLVHDLRIDSLRAELTLFEAARAYAALDGRSEVLPQDIFTVAPMALRMRRSAFMEEFFARQDEEEQELAQVAQGVRSRIGESQPESQTPQEKR